jgi:integrase/recombinase XerC
VDCPVCSRSIIKASTPSTLATSTAPTQRVLDSFFKALTPRTQQAYREALLQFAKWAAEAANLELSDSEDRDLAAVSALVFSWDALNAHTHVTEYVAWLQGRGLAPGTINHRLSALKSLLRLGRVLGIVSWALDVKGVKAGGVRDVRGPDLETVKRILAEEKSRASSRDYAILVLLFERGLRSIEVRELRLEHLKLGVQVGSILVRGKGKAGLTPLTISTNAVEALARWLVQRRVNENCDPSELDAPTSFVFHSPGHPLEPLTKAGIWAIAQRAGKRSGVKLWPHALRHSAITAALDATNGDIRKVQKFSRHQKVETVMKYDDDRRDSGGEVTEMLSERTKK